MMSFGCLTELASAIMCESNLSNCQYNPPVNMIFWYCAQWFFFDSQMKTLLVLHYLNWVLTVVSAKPCTKNN